MTSFDRPPETEVELYEALALTGWRGGSLAALYGLAGRGRFGCPLAPIEPIPSTAWPHLRLTGSAVDNAVRTPEGNIVYDVRVILGSAPGNCEETPSRTVRREKSISETIAEIIDRAEQVGRPMRIEEYGPILKTVGLTLSPMGRLLGAKISNDLIFKATSGATGPHLCRFLMIERWRLRPDLFDLAAARRANARLLHEWVAVQHCNIPGAHTYRHRSPRDLDKFAADLRRQGPKTTEPPK